MADVVPRPRSERERDSHNAGLKTRSYHDVLKHSRYWFSKHRRARAFDIFSRYDRPRVLELGSQTWHSCIEENGLLIDDITCINISEAELDKGIQKAARAKNHPNFKLGDAHKLDFDDKSFDVIFGSAILHHLDFECALREIHRLLKQTGTMFFSEPLDLNPIARMVRRATPKARTEDERPFRRKEFRLLDEYFDCSYTFEEMVSVPVAAMTALLGAPVSNRFGRGAYEIDRLIGRTPGLQYLCRTVFLEGRPKS